LDETLEHLVNALMSAAKGYGIEKRVLLLHGPVGSSKSTIARLLKKGMERYTATDEGALYTLGWHDADTGEVHWCPMNEEPLHLVPTRFRPDIEEWLNAGRGEEDFRVKIEGELDPYCRFMYAQRLKKYGGDWTQVGPMVTFGPDFRAQVSVLGAGDTSPSTAAGLVTLSPFSDAFDYADPGCSTTPVSMSCW
jgi:serine protein kinase